MSIEADLISYLIGINSVTTHVGQRVTPDKRKQGETTLPAVTVHTITGGEQHHLTGGAGYAIPRVQLSVWGATRLSCSTVREALRNVLQGFSGTWGSTTTVGSVTFESGPFLYEEDQVGGDAGTYHQPIDLTIYYKQPVPST